MSTDTSRERRRWGLDGPSLGISLAGASSAEEWQRLLEWADRAESLELHSIWVPEMHFAAGVSASPLLALSAFAGRTRRLRLGTTSLLLPIHAPRRIAEEVAALDTLSGGRVLLGLGRGFRPRLFAAFGVEASTKRDRFDASLDHILELWQGRQSEGAPHLPIYPLQDPHPPLAVAAFGHKGLLQAARRGLPYLASPMEPFSLVEENLKFHRAHLPSSIDPDAVVVPVMRTVYVAGSESEASRVRQALEAESKAFRGRVPPALARAAQAHNDDRVIVGTRSEVTDRLGSSCEALGIDLLIVRPQVSGANEAQQQESLCRLSQDIWPALNSCGA